MFVDNCWSTWGPPCHEHLSTPRLFFLLGFFPKLLFGAARVPTGWIREATSKNLLCFMANTSCIILSVAWILRVRTSIFFSASSCSCGMIGCLGFCSQTQTLHGPLVCHCRGAPWFLHLQLLLHVLFEAWHALPFTWGFLKSKCTRLSGTISNHLFPLPCHHTPATGTQKKTLRLDSLHSLLFNRLTTCNCNNQQIVLYWISKIPPSLESLNRKNIDSPPTKSHSFRIWAIFWANSSRIFSSAVSQAKAKAFFDTFLISPQPCPGSKQPPEGALCDVISMFDVSYSYDICYLYKCIYIISYQLYCIFDVFMLDFMYI